ncbi:MAG: stage III sporulation protein AG [Clostridiales bacterium]|nr:stage III sporulation protein AG [Clostridiales bacterium]
MWKFKSLRGKDKWVFLLTIGVILCILAFPVGAVRTERETETQERDNQFESGIYVGNKWENQTDIAYNDELNGGLSQYSTYVQELEQRVEEILSQVDGVGEVDVMIVLKSSSETVWHTDGSRSRSLTEETDSNGGTRRTESEEEEANTVFFSDSGDSGPVAEKEIYPELSGIVISASGGGNLQVQAEISRAMEALFGLPAHKIKILKRVE